MTKKQIERKPWERREDESAPAFAAFVAFRDMEPAKRSLVDAYRIAKGKPEARQGPGTWNTWRHKFTWDARSAAWDDHLVAEELEAIAAQRRRDAALWERRREKLRQDTHEISQALLRKAEDMLKYPLAQKTTTTSEDGKTITTIVEPVRWNLRDVARFLDTANEVGRLAADLPTAKTATELSGPNGGPIPVTTAPAMNLGALTGDELDTLTALLAKMEGGEPTKEKTP